MKYILSLLMTLGLMGCASNPAHETISYPIVNAVCVDLIGFHTVTGALLNLHPTTTLLIQLPNGSVVTLKTKDCHVHNTGRVLIENI